jgi:hypothetical protein
MEIKEEFAKSTSTRGMQYLVLKENVKESANEHVEIGTIVPFERHCMNPPFIYFSNLDR